MYDSECVGVDGGEPPNLQLFKSRWATLMGHVQAVLVEVKSEHDQQIQALQAEIHRLRGGGSHPIPQRRVSLLCAPQSSDGAKKSRPSITLTAPPDDGEEPDIPVFNLPPSSGDSSNAQSKGNVGLTSALSKKRYSVPPGHKFNLDAIKTPDEHGRPESPRNSPPPTMIVDSAPASANPFCMPLSSASGSGVHWLPVPGLSSDDGPSSPAGEGFFPPQNSRRNSYHISDYDYGHRDSDYGSPDSSHAVYASELEDRDHARDPAAKVGVIIHGPRHETLDRKAQMLQHLKEKQQKLQKQRRSMMTIHSPRVSIDHSASLGEQSQQSQHSDDPSKESQESKKGVKFDTFTKGGNADETSTSGDQATMGKGLSWPRENSGGTGTFPGFLSILPRGNSRQQLKPVDAWQAGGKPGKPGGGVDVSKFGISLEATYEDEYDLIDPLHRTVKAALHKSWVEAVNHRSNLTNKMANKRIRESCDDLGDDVTETWSEWTTRLLVSHPSSKKRLAWDLVGMVFLSFDLIAIPMQAFGDYARMDSTGWMALAWFTSIYWTTDLISSFFLGFHARGHVEMSWGMIVARYVKTWFVLDLALVCTDWTFISLGFSQQASYLRVGKTMSRGMRALRLLRIVRMHSQVSELMDRIHSEYLRTLYSILAIVFGIILINHFLACAWYALGRWSTESHTSASWTRKYFSDKDDLGYRYTTSLHWSLTQFTPASMEVVPQNTLERAYTVCVLVTALVTFSSFVSSITQAMTHLRSMNARRIEQQSVLRRYLNQHGISPQLVNRVWHYLNQRTVQNAKRVRTKEFDVPLLDMLPMSMRLELRTESFTPELKRHPFFLHFGIENQAAFRQICTQALTELSLLARHELYSDNISTNIHMFFVTEGRLEYLLPCACAAADHAKRAGDEFSTVGTIAEEALEDDIFAAEEAETSGAHHVPNPCDIISKGEWACEAALWVEKVELCSPFVACDRTELLVLNTEKFQKLAGDCDTSQDRILRYAEAFVHHLPKITLCRWRIAICNEPSTIQDLAHRAFDFDGTHKMMKIKRAGSGQKKSESKNDSAPFVPRRVSLEKDDKVESFQIGGGKSNKNEAKEELVESFQIGTRKATKEKQEERVETFQVGVRQAAKEKKEEPVQAFRASERAATPDVT